MDRVTNYAMQGCSNNDERVEVEAAANAASRPHWMGSFHPCGMPPPVPPYFYPAPPTMPPPAGPPMQQVSEGPRVRGGDPDAGKSGPKVKLPNFNPEEDVNLTKWWLNISTDPVVNTGQRKEGFWLRIMKGYNSSREVYPERSQKSLTTRWDYIKECCTKFSEFYSCVLRLNPSGMSDADKTTEAMARYAAALQKPFTQMHSWKLLKDEPKWEACIGAHSKVHVLDDDSSDAAAGGANGVGGPAESDPPASSGSKRPAGRDTTKAASKKAATSSSSSEYISQMNDMWGNKLSLIKESHAEIATHHATMAVLQEKKMSTERELEERRLALEESRLAMEASRLEMEKSDRESRMEMQRSRAAKEERAEEERILSIDLDRCSPALRLFYKRQQEQILAKYSLPPP
ncbi:glutathione S-transferase T3-like [Panicum hallii]|uniref:glutathione S-transferase T3-like n=1 Tax=Panicum hallii TaxID=206008 RepID=UPI000DF4EDDF|nr:glutathione S-transferase T3-like [Panicum hallii]